jgi:hypothetical protein
LFTQNLPRACNSVRLRNPEIFPPALQFVPRFRAKILPAAKQHQLSTSFRRALLPDGS